MKLLLNKIKIYTKLAISSNNKSTLDLTACLLHQRVMTNHWGALSCRYFSEFILKITGVRVCVIRVIYSQLKRLPRADPLDPEDRSSDIGWHLLIVLNSCFIRKSYFIVIVSITE